MEAISFLAGLVAFGLTPLVLTGTSFRRDGVEPERGRPGNADLRVPELEAEVESLAARLWVQEGVRRALRERS